MRQGSHSSSSLQLPHAASDIAAAERHCRQRVNQRAWVSAGAAVVPVPGLDIAVDVRNVMRMLSEINQAFGLTPAQIEALAPRRRVNVYRVISTMSGSAVGRFITREVALTLMKSLAKRIVAKQASRWVPLAGQVAAAGLSYAAIRWIGDRHIDDCVAVARAVARGARAG